MDYFSERPHPAARAPGRRRAFSIWARSWGETFFDVVVLSIVATVLEPMTGHHTDKATFAVAFASMALFTANRANRRMGAKA